MKTLLILMLAMIAGGAHAQTNYGFITFTNKTGNLIERAEVYKVDSARVYYWFTTGSGGGSVLLSDLPEVEQKRFNYQPTDAAVVLAIEATNKQRDENQARATAQRLQSEAALAAKKREVAKTLAILHCRVVQRIEDYLLVDCSGEGGGRNWVGYASTPEYTEFMKGKDYWPTQKKYGSEKGLVLLVDYPRVSKVADDDGFITIAYPVGTYEYTAVSGGKKTVRKYSCDINAALNQ